MEPVPQAAVLSGGPPLIPPGATDEKVVEISLERFRPSPYNPRVFPSKPSHELIDLAKSIRRIGLIQPGTVRPIRADNTPILPGEAWTDEDVHVYEVVAGERRYRASKMKKGDKGLPKEEGEALDAIGPAPTTMKVIVRLLTDKEAMEVTAVENLDREELSPIEEANGVATLMMLYGSDVEAVAARLSRPASWVQQRNRLSKLSKKWRKAMVDGESGFHTWTTAHLVEIARLDPSAQDALLEQFRSPAGMSVGQVRGIVANETRTIGTAPFDIEDCALVPSCGGCTTCPKTSASAPGLFEDFGEEIHPSDLRKARCLDPSCWMKKAEAFARAKLAALQAEHPNATVVFHDYNEQYKLPKDLQGKALHYEPRYSWQLKQVEAGTSGAFPGIYLVGSRIGQVVWLKRKQETSSYSGRAAKPAGPTPLSDRRAQLDRRRKAEAVKRVAAALEASKVVPETSILLRLAIAFGTKEKRDGLYDGYGGGGDPWKAFKSGEGMLPQDLGLLLWQNQIRPVLLSRLTYTGSGCDVAKLFLNAHRAGELVGIDADAILRETIESMPEPKSWAFLNKDGTPKTKKAAQEGKPNGKEDRKAAGATGAGTAKGGRASSAKVREAVGTGKVASKSSTPGKAPSTRRRKGAVTTGAEA